MAGRARRQTGEVDYLMHDPLVRLRIELATRFKTGMDSASYVDFLERMQYDLGLGGYFREDVEIAHRFLETGEAPKKRLFLEETTSQLLWAATFTHMLSDYQGYCAIWHARKLAAMDPEELAGLDEEALAEIVTPKPIPIEENPLYVRFMEDKTVKRMMLDYAYNVVNQTKNPKVKFKWGTPGSWFYFNPKENLINIDLVQTMIGGFRDTLSIVFHEIGHSQLTVHLPKEQLEIKKKIEPFEEKIRKDEELSEEEYKEYRRLAAFWKLRHTLSDACENNPVNRFAANRSGSLGAHLRRSLNRTFMAVSGGGRKYVENKRTGEPEEQKPQNVLEEFLEKTLGLKRKKQHDADLIPDASNDNDENPQRQFQNVIWAINCVFFNNNALFGDAPEEWKKVGVDPGILKLDPDIRAEVLEKFPHAKDHWNPDLAVLEELCGGEEGLENLQPDLADRYRFGADFFSAKTDHYMDLRNNINQNIWDWYLKKHAEKLLEEEEKKTEKELQQAKDGKDGKKKNNGKGQKGQKGDGQASGKGEKGNEQDEGGQDGENKVKVKGAGDMPDPKPDTGNREEAEAREKKKDGPGQDGKDEKDGKDGKDKKDGDGQEGKTLDELMEDYKRSMDGKPENKKDKDKGNKTATGNSDKKITLDDLAKGSFSDYQALVEKLQPFIQYTMKRLDAFQDRQITRAPKVVKSRHTLIPEYNDAGRLNQDRHIARVQKKNPSVEDRKVFKSTRRQNVPAAFEFALGIDGSSSMVETMYTEDEHYTNKRNPNVVDPLKVAILKAVVIFEACRRMNQSAYIYIWGNEDPIMLAEPGDSYQKIGENMTRIENGLQCGTDFLPALKTIVKKIAWNRKKTHAVSGYTHHMILSDGDIFGSKNVAVDMCETLLEEGVLQTLDFEIIRKIGGANTPTGLEGLAKEIKSEDPKKNVGVNVSRVNKIEMKGTLDMVTKKFTGGPVRAVSTSKKKKSLQRISTGWDLS